MHFTTLLIIIITDPILIFDLFYVCLRMCVHFSIIASQREINHLNVVAMPDILVEWSRDNNIGHVWINNLIKHL